MSKEYFKKTLAGIFALAIVASSIPLAPYTKVLNSISITASAAETYDDLVYEIVDDSITIIGYNGTDGDVVIPSTIDGASVTSIGDWAFSGCAELTSVTIPDSVTSIGESAFSDCAELTSVTIPASVTNIDDFAFVGCSSLSSVTIPDSVKSIGYGAFGNCSALTEIVIPDTATSIGELVFYGCSALTEITIPDSVTSICKEAFGLCSELKNVYYTGSKSDWESVSIENGNDALKNATITYNYRVRNTIPNSTLTWEIDENGVLTISGDDEAFPECWVNDEPLEWCDKKKDVKEVVFVTPKLKKLGSAAFYEFPMTTITLPSTLTEIGYAAFKHCAKLESLDIPKGVKEIPGSLLEMEQDESNGWASITSLKSISMASDVTKIGGWAFANCTSVKSFDGLSDSLKVITSLGDGALMGLSIDDTLIYIPKTLNQTSIGMYTFNGANIGTDLEIPSFITEIGENAFGWANLENVIIPASVSKIDKNAFVGWGNLKTITLLGAADSVTIDDEAFSGNNVEWNTMTFYVPVSQVDAYKTMKALEGSNVIGQAAATFDLGGKGDNFTLNTDDEVKITEPMAPTADGVVFAGWYTDNTYATEFNFNDALTDDEVTIYAKWKNEYTVTFDANSVTPKETLDSKTYLDGDALGELPELTADGYVFKGWKDSNGASVTDATKVTDNMTLYAQWKDIWTVTFDMNGVTPKEALSPKPFEDGTMISSGQYPTPKADGYVFDGWYADAACSSPALSGYFHADQTVYAKWIKVYDVTFDCGEYGSISGDSTLSTNKQGVLSYVPTPTPKDGYSFDGWYTDEKFTNKFDETAVITKDTTLYAKYQAYVDFYVDGYCESIDSRLIELGSTTEDPGTPTVLDEYSSFVTFAGWYTDEDYKTKFDFSKPITASTTVYAKWNVEMTVNFDTGETGVEIPSVKVMAGDKIKMPDVDDYEIIDIFTDKTMFNNFYIDEPIPVRKSGVFTLYVELLQLRGDCGENLRWEFNLEDYIMTVSGTGTKIMDCTQAQAWNPEGLRYICVIFDTPNLKEIGSSAFRDAEIPFLNIPSTVTKINDYAFSNCRHLLSVTFESSEPPVLGNSVFGSDSQLCAMYVPADAVDTYKAAYPEYKDIIQANPVGMLGYSVSYDGDVTINFHMNIQNAADSDFLYLVDHNDYLMVADAKTGSKADEYIFSISLPAKNMYDPITVQYGTDTQPIGGQYTFKLEDYMDAFKDTAPDTKTKAFVDSFLEYGKQAAAYFGNTNAPASEKTYDYDSIISALKADGYNKLPDMGSNYVGATMLLKSIPILRLYYKDEVTGLDLGEYGYWDINDNNLDMTFIQKKIIVTDFDTTFNGYSVYHYFYKAFESGDEKLMKLCAALYELGHAANDI